MLYMVLCDSLEVYDAMGPVCCDAVASPNKPHLYLSMYTAIVMRVCQHIPNFISFQLLANSLLVAVAEEVGVRQRSRLAYLSSFCPGEVNHHQHTNQLPYIVQFYTS